MPHPLRCVIMRGGTSKAVFLKEADIPADPEARRRLILAVYGSPDRRQIDGLGGADPLTSKLAIIGPPREGLPRAAGTHLTYTFGQVEIDHPEVDWRSLCGNISAAVGAFADLRRHGRARPPRSPWCAPTTPTSIASCASRCRWSMAGRWSAATTWCPACRAAVRAS